MREMKGEEENNAILDVQLDYFPDARLDDIDSKKEVFKGQSSNFYSRFASRKRKISLSIRIRYYIR